MMPSFAVWAVVMLCILLGFSFAFVVLTPSANPIDWGGPFWVAWWALLGDFSPSSFQEITTSAEHAVFAEVLLWIYLVIALIVMVNLLIALFADDYAAMKDEWAYNQKLVSRGGSP